MTALDDAIRKRASRRLAEFLITGRYPRSDGGDAHYLFDQDVAHLIGKLEVDTAVLQDQARIEEIGRRDLKTPAQRHRRGDGEDHQEADR